MGDYSEARAGNRRSPLNDTRSYSGSGGASAYDNPPIETGSIVRDGLSANEETLAELHETINRLESRLETALTPMPPQPTGASSTTPVGPPCSQVAVRLAQLNQGYRQAVGRLRELVQRVEV